MDEGRRLQSTNRHIAKLLSRLEPLKLPQIALDEMKREMWFLSEDLRDISAGKQGDWDEEKKDRSIKKD